MDREKIFNVQVKDVGGAGKRVLRFIGSDETSDRSGDVINVDGWQIDNYLKNPVFMYGHDYSRPPVGKTVALSVDRRNRKLVFDVEFPTIEALSSDPERPSEHALFADLVYNMFKAGYLNATSVGFRGLEMKTRDDPEAMKLPEWQRGYRFDKQELFELSAVPIPDNPNALVAVRSMKEFRPEAEPILEAIVAKAAANVEEEAEMADLKEILARLDAQDTEIKSLRSQLGGTVEKAGRKFSAETMEKLEAHAKALDEICGAHGESLKSLKAAHKALREMIDAAKESSGTEAPGDNDVPAPEPKPAEKESSGSETAKPNDGPAPKPVPEKAAPAGDTKGIDGIILEIED